MPHGHPQMPSRALLGTRLPDRTGRLHWRLHRTSGIDSCDGYQWLAPGVNRLQGNPELDPDSGRQIGGPLWTLLGPLFVLLALFRLHSSPNICGSSSGAIGPWSPPWALVLVAFCCPWFIHPYKGLVPIVSLLGAQQSMLARFHFSACSFAGADRTPRSSVTASFDEQKEVPRTR